MQEQTPTGGGETTITLNVPTVTGLMIVKMPAATTAKFAAKRVVEALIERGMGGAGIDPGEYWVLKRRWSDDIIDDDVIVSEFDGQFFDVVLPVDFGFPESGGP